ncbi:hypothetical protein CERZMDRAFT_102743 [Cercospora zeae-maydis SCOH1-5]|uniref:MYND-type domain-containing protein n=1 Tax=Cercospora zeae-maydis SCOH1-5 TaxID=717836 RepID=A0A6A6EZC4_9PEZI|nr:hypothetical protein CERZMDRAFT_102743 [Cercospora zeae-maydis SCOH1-5]
MPAAQFTGSRLFENGNDLKTVAKFNKEARLQEREDEANANISDPALKVCYSTYAKLCRGVGAVEAVRKHFDSDVLSQAEGGLASLSLLLLVVTWQQGYHMFFDTYNKFLLGVCGTAPITDEACCQIYHAAIASASQSMLDRTHGMLAIGAKVGRGGPQIPSIIGPCGKADMGYTEDVDCCGHEKCGKASAKLKCSRCHDQLYCDKTCQSTDWGRHKVVCRTPEMRKDIEDKPQKWTNLFDLLLGRI